MQVKICPKCKAENKLSNTSCSSCYASLEGALLSEAPDPVVPPAQENAEPAQPRVGAPAPSGEPAQSMPRVGERPAEGPGSQAAVPPPVYTPPSREDMRPVKQGPNVGAIVMLIILLGGAGFGAWWFLLRPKSPSEVVTAFVAACKSGDMEQIKSHLSSGSKGLMDAPGAAEGIKRSFQGNQNADSSKEDPFKIDETTFEGDTALVKVTPTNASKAPTGMDNSSEVVLVKEEGQWKIDLQKTMQRAMQKVFDEMKKRGNIPPGMKPF